MTTINRLKQAFNKRIQGQEFRAVLGDINGVIDEPGFPGKVRVRFTTADGLSAPYTAAMNANIQKQVGMPVVIGYNDFDELAVLRPNTPAQAASGVNPLGNNASDPNANYFINQSQITTLVSHRISTASDTMTVTIQPWISIENAAINYFGGGDGSGAAAIDLTAYIPGSSDEQCLACLFIETTTYTVEVQTSTPVGINDTLGFADIQECLTAASAGAQPVWAWRLYNGQTNINPQPYTVGGDDFCDLRQFIGGGSGGMTSFFVAGDSGTPGTVTDGDTLSILGGDGIVSTTSSPTVTLDVDSTVVRTTGAQSVDSKTINSSDIGTTTPGAGYFSALRLKIGSFFGIFTHANSADRTYTLPNASGTIALTSDIPTSAPVNATYITQTPDSTLTNEQALSLLSTGIMKSTTTTGVVSIAAAGTDYTSPTGTENLSNKTITASSLIATALSLLIGGFKAIFTHANTADRTYTFPDYNATIATITGTETLTNKTLTTPTIGNFTNATHSHQNAAGGGQLNAGSVFSAGQVPLARGGTNADLSATGGTSQYLKQASVGAAVTVGTIAAADVPAISTVKENGSNVVTSATALDFKDSNVESPGSNVAAHYLDLEFVCQGRLTLNFSGSGQSYLNSADTIYFRPYNGNSVSHYDGTRWVRRRMGSGYSLSVPLTVNQTFDILLGYTAGDFYLTYSNWNAPTGSSITGVSNANPPVITASNSLSVGDVVTIRGVGGATGANGTWRVSAATGTTFTIKTKANANPGAPGVYTSGGSWTKVNESQTRATLLTTQDGRYVLNGDPTLLYLGMARTIETPGFIDCEYTRRFLINQYNKIAAKMRVVETTDSWSYTTASYRAMHDDFANRLEVITDDDQNSLLEVRCMSNVAAGNGVVANGIGNNSATVNSADLTGMARNNGASTTNQLLWAEYLRETNGGSGNQYAYLQALEYGNTGATFYGDNGMSSVIQSGIIGKRYD